MGEVRNIRIQIGYQAYVVDFLVLDIPIDYELPLLLGRVFLRTCRAIIDIGRRTMSIDDRLCDIPTSLNQEPTHTWKILRLMKKKIGLVALKWVVMRTVSKCNSKTPIGEMNAMECTRRLKVTGHGTPSLRKLKKVHTQTRYAKQNDKGTINYSLQQVTNANLRWRDLSCMERHAYSESFDETLKDLIKMEYLHNDRDVFVDYSRERALAIEGDVYPEWCLEFFSTMYFKKGVDRTKLMTEKCVWFRLYRLEVDHKLFDHNEYWKKIGKPTKTNKRTSLIREPLMQIMHWLIIGALVHRLGSKERCQTKELWMMGAFEDACGINVAWVIDEYLYKSASGIKENSDICGGDGYFSSSIPNLGGTSIVPSSGYEVGGSLGAMQDEDDDDAFMREQRTHMDDDMGSEED
nr:hypothetical protein [Tanacetum cinerariifolium]